MEEKMKRLTKWVLLAGFPLFLAAIAALPSCTEETLLGGEIASADYRFESRVGERPATKTAGSGALWAADDRVGISLVKSGDASWADLQPANVAYRPEAAGVGTSTASLLFDATAVAGTGAIHAPDANPAMPVDFVAYYPWAASATASGILSLDVSGQDTCTTEASFNQLDALFARTEQPVSYKKGRAVPLHFRHKMALLVLRLNSTEEAVQKDGLSLAAGSTVELQGFPSKASLDLFSGQLTASDAANYKAAFAAAGSYPTGGPNGLPVDSAFFKAIIPAHDLAAFTGHKLLITPVSGLTYEVDVDAAFGKISRFEEGKRYTLRLTLDRKADYDGSGEIGGWDDGDEEVVIDPTPPESKPQPIVLKLSSTELNVSGSASSTAVDGPKVSTNAVGGWTATTTADWLQLGAATKAAGSSASGTTGQTLTFKVLSDNPSSADSREAEVLVTANDTVSARFRVIQAPAGLSLLLSIYSASPDGSARKDLVGPVVTTNYSGWQAAAEAASAAWITGVTASGTSGQSVKYSLSENPSSAQSRKGGIVVTAGALSDTFRIEQAAAGVTLSLSPTSATLASAEAQSNLTGPTVMTNYSGWTASTADTWITGVTASGTPGGSVKYSVSANTGAARTGTIKVSANGKTANFTVSQPIGHPANSFDIAGLDLWIQEYDQPTGQTWYVYSNTPDGTDEYATPPYPAGTSLPVVTREGTDPAFGMLASFVTGTQSNPARSGSCAAIATDDSSKPWRLPTIEELHKMNIAVKNNPVAKNFSSAGYWSASTRGKSYKSNAWFVSSFVGGSSVNSTIKLNTGNIGARCVRSK